MIDTESHLWKNNELQNLVGTKHIEELSPYLFGHHFHFSLVRHTPHCGNLVRPATGTSMFMQSVPLNNGNDLVVEVVMVDDGWW